MADDQTKGKTLPSDSSNHEVIASDVADVLTNEKQFQRQLFHFFTPIALVFLLAYAALQAKAGLNGVALLYAAGAAVIAVNWWALRFHHNTTLAANLFVSIGPLVLLPWQVTGGLSGSGLMWFPAFVVFAMFFVRGKGGIFWVAFLYGASLVLLLLQLQGQVALPFPRNILVHFYFVGAITFAIALLFRRSQKTIFDLLKSQAASLKQAEEIARIGNWWWDIETNVIHWSGQLYRIFDVEPGTKVDYETYLERIYPEDRKVVDGAVRQALQDHQPYATIHRVQRLDGSILWIQSLGQVVLDDEGKPIRMLGTAQDISNRITYERQVAERTEELEKLNKLMIGRELKMIELKEELKMLEESLSSIRKANDKT